MSGCSFADAPPRLGVPETRMFAAARRHSREWLDGCNPRERLRRRRSRDAEGGLLAPWSGTSVVPIPQLRRDQARRVKPAGKAADGSQRSALSTNSSIPNTGISAAKEAEPQPLKSHVDGGSFQASISALILTLFWNRGRNHPFSLRMRSANFDVRG